MANRDAVGTERDATGSGDAPFEEGAWPRAGWRARVAAALVATAGLWVQRGVVGLAAGVALTVGALGLRGWTLFALGQVALVALTPQDGPLGPLVVIEAGLFWLLVGDAVRDSGPRAVLEAGSATALLGLLAWSAWRWQATVWAVVLPLVAVVAVAGYGLHRYERLSLGYLEDHRERH